MFPFKLLTLALATVFQASPSNTEDVESSVTDQDEPDDQGPSPFSMTGTFDTSQLMAPPSPDLDGLDDGPITAPFDSFR